MRATIQLLPVHFWLLVYGREVGALALAMFRQRYFCDSGFLSSKLMIKNYIYVIYTNSSSPNFETIVIKISV